MPSVRAKMEVFRLSWQLAWSIPQLLRDRDPNEHSSEIPAGFWTHSTLSLPLSGSSQKAKKLKSNKCRLSKNLVRFRGWNLAIGLMNKYWTGKQASVTSFVLPSRWHLRWMSLYLQIELLFRADLLSTILIWLKDFLFDCWNVRGPLQSLRGFLFLFPAQLACFRNHWFWCASPYRRWMFFFLPFPWRLVRGK